MATRRTAAAVVAALTLAACRAGTQPDTVPPTLQTTASASADAPSGDGGTDSEAADGRVDVGGSWSPLPASPLEARDGEWFTGGGVFSGIELLAWGQPVSDQDGTGPMVATAPIEVVAFDPESESWRVSSPAPELGDDRAPRWMSDTVWTGQELLILGGGDLHDRDSLPSGDEDWLAGLAWNPVTDTWRSLPPPPLDHRWGHSATWVGDRLVLWGGWHQRAPSNAGGEGVVQPLADGASWDPQTNAWTRTAPALIDGRGEHAAVWNGRRLLVFAGGWSNSEWEPRFTAEVDPAQAAVWDPSTNTWTRIAPLGSAAGPMIGAVWTGDAVLWWNGGTSRWAEGLAPYSGLWDPITGEERLAGSPEVHLRRDDAPLLWITDLDVGVTWGGACGEGCNTNLGDGSVLSDVTPAWRALPSSGLDPRSGHVLAWDGRQLLVWGGNVYDAARGVQRLAVDGARWDPHPDPADD